MTLTKQCYTTKYNNFKTVSDNITHIKTLKERILATDVVLTPDKQSILCLSISLHEHFQYLTKLWDLTPDMTVAKAASMLLEEKGLFLARLLTPQMKITTSILYFTAQEVDQLRFSRRSCKSLITAILLSQRFLVCPEQQRLAPSSGKSPLFQYLSVSVNPALKYLFGIVRSCDTANELAMSLAAKLQTAQFSLQRHLDGASRRQLHQTHRTLPDYPRHYFDSLSRWTCQLYSQRQFSEL